MLYTLAFSLLIGLAAAKETVHGAVIFSRHGDRTWKNTPPTKLTSLGQSQLYQSGQYWRDRYLNSSSAHQISGISEDVYSAAQLYASAPDQPVLVTSGQAFLQGLYPPDSSATEKLTNGLAVIPPLNGFQYAALHTVQDDSAESLWLKGDDSCPAYDNASGQWMTTSTSAQALQKSTKAFYMKFYDNIFKGVVPQEQVDYENAYALYDYINVGVWHNSTIADLITTADMRQLRTLADSREFAQNGAVSAGDASNPLAVSGRTLARKILTQMGTVISSQGSKQKLSLLIGSYDTFLAFFGLAGLPAVSTDFMGLPSYASAISFELLSFLETQDFPGEKDLFVRFLFRNGTDSGDAIEFPLFGASREGAVLPWTRFLSAMSAVAINSTNEWCEFCGSKEGFCQLLEGGSGATSTESHRSHYRLSPAVAGGVGAVSAIVFLGLCAMAAGLLGVRLGQRKKAVIAVGDKGYSESCASGAV